MINLNIELFFLGLRKLSLEIRSPVLSSQLNYIASASMKLKEIEITGLQLKAIQPGLFVLAGFQTLPHCTISLKVLGYNYEITFFFQFLQNSLYIH